MFSHFWEKNGLLLKKIKFTAIITVLFELGEIKINISGTFGNINALL
jgi:hypothetical protein